MPVSCALLLAIPAHLVAAARKHATPIFRKEQDGDPAEDCHTAFAPGSKFMGADLAEWLDDQLAKFGKGTSQ